MDGLIVISWVCMWELGGNSVRIRTRLKYTSMYDVQVFKSTSSPARSYGTSGYIFILSISFILTMCIYMYICMRIVHRPNYVYMYICT